ncbi:MAG: SpoIIE family protein phosphatase [Bacteroidetes bacterium]|nr:SpoIIE family protein phosphatase [Bacteroidota bacterium]
MLNITVPVILVLVLFSYINYRYNKRELELLNQERLQQIQDEVQNLIEIHDLGMKMNERHFEARMEKISHELVTLFDTRYDPATADLYQLSEEIGLDTNTESVYIIDTNGVVVNTSFYKDLHLDFYARGEGYREYFEKIWAQNGFFADRFSAEQVTGRIKKWSFIPTRNGLYLVELGFLSEEAKIMRETLLTKVNAIADKHNDIEQVFLAMQVKGEYFEGIDDSMVQQKMQEVLVSQKNQRIITEEPDRTVFEDLIYIKVLLEETSMFNGIILYIKSDDSKERQLAGQAIRRFAVMAGIAIFILILIITFRARTITRPIIRLTKKAEMISSGKLDERIEEEGENEITQLSRSFNHMVEQLQESYQTLEQKVIDRTTEVVEQKNEAEYQRHLVEEKHKEITDSINYAERIQRSFLATKDLLDENLKAYFVFFQPKDVVSGDFYWATKLPNNHFALVTADSTGHGVPGAIMSILNITCLEKAVQEEKLVDPGDILNHARLNIIDRLKKDGSKEGGKDGMDASLVCLDLKNKKLNYAAANNPVWIVRQTASIADSPGHEIIECEPDKMPVGKHDKQHIPFTSKQIDLQNGDVIYALTDGLPDQFGGEKGKKFMYKRLKEFLISIAEYPMDIQREKLKNAFFDWKGDLEQVDDVCVIGIKI